MSKSSRILIVGGGSGGHVFCGLAIAEAFKLADPTCEIRFGGSRFGLENIQVPKSGYHLYAVSMRGWYRVSWWKKMQVLILLPWAVLQSVVIMLGYRPHLVLGVGGYASVPFLIAARVLRLHISVVEFNAAVGIANRIAANWANPAFVSVPETAAQFKKAMSIGTPLRRAILEQRETPLPLGTKRCLLILGGSQGARIINQTVIEALPMLAEWTQTHPLRIIHQSGRADFETVQKAYQAHPDLDAEVLAFIERIETSYAQATLVISRAGASAVNEIIATRRPALYIPITHSSADHQRKNAYRVEAAGAAVVIEENQLQASKLAEQITALFTSESQLQNMAACTDSLYGGDAAMAVAERCLALIRKT